MRGPEMGRRGCREFRRREVSRREALRAGAVAMAGLGLPELYRNHDDFTHLSTAHRILTGHLAPTPHSDAAGPSPNDWPHLGSLVARVQPRTGALPPAVTMPWTVAHPAAPGGKAPGQHGGWLGKA